MWTLIYVSQSLETAEKLMHELKKNEVISRLRRGEADGNSMGCFEVLVPSTEMEQAQKLIFENELF